MDMKISSLLLSVAAGVCGILPDFGYDVKGQAFENGKTASENLPIVYVNRKGEPRVAKCAREGLTIDELTEKLQNKVNAISEEKSDGGVPAKSMRELEDLMAHPTWLTDTSSNKGNDHLMSKNRSFRTFIVPPPGGNWYSRPDVDSQNQMDHIREVITKFHDLKPKSPITDNRITKFVFTHDADLATSRTVQQHNREVEMAFADFNKKLEETLNANKKPENKKNTEKEIDRSFNRVVNFLDRHIRKLKEENPHKQVCRNHKSHSKEPDRVKDISETGNDEKIGDSAFGELGAPLNRAGMLRFNELAQTRDGLENALLGLDRPRGGPYKRHVSLKFGRGHGHPVKSQPKKHN